MDITLYKNSAPPNKVDKSGNLSKTKTYENVRFIETGALDILNPTVVLNMGSEIAEVSKYNYMKIGKFNRYYYIDEISTEGGLIRIKGRCDVLMSHQKDIYASTQYVMRQEKYNNSPYLDDNMLPIRSDHSYICKPITSSDAYNGYVDDRSCGRIILATTGKGGTVI